MSLFSEFYIYLWDQNTCIKLKSHLIISHGYEDIIEQKWFMRFLQIELFLLNLVIPPFLLQGKFEIISLSGSFISDDNGGHSMSGGLSVSLAGSDGQVLGGGVAGVLQAASPVQASLCN